MVERHVGGRSSLASLTCTSGPRRGGVPEGPVRRENMMGNRIAATATWGLALLVGLTASAQTGNSSDQSKGPQGGSQASKDRDKSGEGLEQCKGQSRTIRGEMAGVSVVGETMVDYSSGRGVVAEFTYLTILGSPSDAHSGQGSKDHAASGRRTRAIVRDKDQADKGHGSNDPSGGSSAAPSPDRLPDRRRAGDPGERQDREGFGRPEGVGAGAAGRDGTAPARRPGRGRIHPHGGLGSAELSGRGQ